MFRPNINDITTSFIDPPQFTELAKKNPKRDYAYPEKFVEKQRSYYKNIGPIETSLSKIKVFKIILKIIEEKMNWRVVNSDFEKFRIEAVATTTLFRFKDDIVIELRNTADVKTQIHMRSRSRLGQNDFGANASRINALFEIIRKENI